MLKSILRHEWLFWIVACVLTVFLTPASSPLLFIAFAIALPLFGLLRYWTQLPLFPSVPVAIPIIGLLIMIAVSAVVTPDLPFSLRKISGMLNSIGLFVALTVTAHRTIPNWLLLLFGLIIASVGAIGSDIYARIPLLFPLFRLFYLIVPFLPNVQRVINANLVAGALLWTLPVSVGICLFYWRKNNLLVGAFSSIFVLAQAIMLLIMQSRAALLAISLSGVWAIWYALPPIRTAIRNGCLVLATLIVLLILPIWPDTFKTSLQETYFALLVKGDEGERGLNSIDSRVKIWQRSIEKISERPLAGHGLNIFRKIANSPTPVFLSAKEIPHAHHWALQIILELGLFGLFFYVWLIVAVFKSFWRSWRLNTADRPILLGYAAALIAFMLFGLLDTISPGARPDFIFWILLAGTHNLISKESKTTQPETGLETMTE